MRYMNNEKGELPQVLINPLQDLTEHVLRKCSNKKCKKMEEKERFNLFCPRCQVMVYCSESCKKAHKSKHKQLCSWLYHREMR